MKTTQQLIELQEHRTLAVDLIEVADYCKTIGWNKEAEAIALVPELLAEVIRLREALSESVALNENFVSVVEPETLLHLSEYRAVIKQARAALANDK